MAKNIGIVRWFTNTKSQDRNYGFIKFLRGDDDLSPDDKIYFRKSDIVSTVPQWNDCVSFNLKSHWQERNVNCWRVNNVIVLNWSDFPLEIILTYWDELNDDNKRALFVKCFDILPVDKLADIAKDLPPAKIFDAVKNKPTFIQKLPAIVEVAAQSKNFNDWAKIILANDLPSEIILTYWDELNDDNKRAAFVKCFDILPVDKLIDIAKDFPPAEFVDKFSGKKTFIQKLPAIIEHSNKKFNWAQCLLDNVAIFSQINVGEERKIQVDEDVMIFFMYEWVKRDKPLHELTSLFQKKIDVNASLYAKIIYLYICAAHERNISSGRHSELMNRAQKAVAEIFNKRVKALENQSQNPIESCNFDTPKTQVLPPCRNSYNDNVRKCSFCEAVVWSKKVSNEDETYHWENHSWCRRLEAADLYCSRLFPDLNLSAKDWSLIELTDKLDLRTYEKYSKDHKLNREIFTRFGGELNRLNELRERIKCRKCGQYMRADLDKSKWLVVKNIKDIANVDHFPVLIATFKCQNNDCPEKGKEVYLSYCWHCGETIDSRDSKVKIAGKGSGYYLCNSCGAGYKDYIDPHGEKKDGVKYAIYPGTICPSCTKCPKCGGQNFDLKETADGQFNLVCKCGQSITVRDTLQDITSNKASKYKKYECSACKHKLEINHERLNKQLGDTYVPVIWA